VLGETFAVQTKKNLLRALSRLREAPDAEPIQAAGVASAADYTRADGATACGI
jgi:hypothetical protein